MGLKEFPTILLKKTTHKTKMCCRQKALAPASKSSENVRPRIDRKSQRAKNLHPNLSVFIAPWLSKLKKSSSGGEIQKKQILKPCSSAIYSLISSKVKGKRLRESYLVQNHAIGLRGSHQPRRLGKSVETTKLTNQNTPKF